MIGKKNVLLEGISDYYFLLAMAEYLGISGKIENVSFIPSKGAGQMHYVASILIGWGQEFVAVVDNDKAGNGAKADLKELNVEDRKIVVTSGEKDAEIEDLFSSEDFVAHVLPENTKTEEGKRNSQLVKNKSDKVILAKQLMDKIRSSDKPKLSKETTNNFLELFRNITEAFEAAKDEPQPAANDTSKEKTG